MTHRGRDRSRDEGDDGLDVRESISAGLEQIQRRQELLALGTVSPRPRTGIQPACHDAAASESSWPSAAERLLESHIDALEHGAASVVTTRSWTNRTNPVDATPEQHHRTPTRERQHAPSNTPATDEITAHAHHTQRIRWVRRPVQRLSLQRETIEEVGAIEFATIASLASVRQLIDQFYPLPNKREYEFYHPVLRVRIDPSGESNVFPWEFSAIVFAVLPLPPRVRVAAAPAATEPSSIERQGEQLDSTAVVTRATTATEHEKRSDSSKNQRAVPVSALETRTAASTSQRAAYQDLVFANRIVSGARCDVVIREFHMKGTVGVKARMREGVFVGRTTQIKWISSSDVASLTEQFAEARAVGISEGELVANGGSPANGGRTHHSYFVCATSRSAFKQVRRVDRRAGVVVPCPAFWGDRHCSPRADKYIGYRQGIAHTQCGINSSART